jgi:hypothetical protein
MSENINWQAATKQVAAADRKWLQSLSVEDSIRLYFSLARFALSQRDETEGWRRLEEQRWQEKIAYRLKLQRAVRIAGSVDER